MTSLVTPIARDLASPRRIVGALALALSVQYLVAEAIAAAGWVRTPYSYRSNYISDLGVPECFDLPDRVVCSPLHVVMNVSFVAQGILAAIAIVCLSGLVSARVRWIPVLFGALHAIGIVMVGLFPGSIAEDLGGDANRMLLHSIGALLAIGGGNAFAIAVGATMFARTRVYGVISILVGAIGLSPLVLQPLLIGALGVGGVERLMVYPFILWMIGTGVTAATVGVRATVPADRGEGR